MRKVYFWLYIVYLSIKWVFKFNLGDSIKYKGDIYILNQGVCCPCWDIKKLNDDNIYIKNVHQDNFRKVLTLKNLYGSFNSGYSFYMVNWYDIWVRNGIKPWMKNCRIW